jgi:penicillin-binding protein 2
MKFFKKKNKIELDPDEIFLDSSNLPKYNKREFEGRLEKPISSLTIFLVGFFSFLIISLFAARAYYLQIVKGEEYRQRAENNRLDYLPIFAGRGIIKDRNGVPLVKNDLSTTTSSTTTEVPRRIYIEEEGFSHILGFVSYPKKDRTGIFWQENYIGREGVEKQYDSLLSGTPGKKLIETNALQKVTSENTIESGVDGENITLSIDSRVQKELFYEIKNDRL